MLDSMNLQTTGTYSFSAALCAARGSCTACCAVLWQPEVLQLQTLLILCMPTATQAELEERKKDIQSLHVRIARQDSDIKQLSTQYRSAQQNYERQVCHAAPRHLRLCIRS